MITWLPHPLNGTPFGDLVTLCVLVAAVIWGLSKLSGEVCWIDRYWSTAPPLYALYMAASVSFSNLRLNLMAGLVLLWGVRLTYNFWRKGGFGKDNEDYRWVALRERMTPLQFELFNIGFISYYNSFLVLALCAPMHTAWVYRDAAVGVWEGVMAALFVLLWLGEAVADEQMWRFQQEKKARLARGESIEAPFFWAGLYRYSRHPNYFCEMGQWWVFYGFAIAASGVVWHWTLIGALLLTLMFDGSVRFSEGISSRKYPGYARYQQEVSRLLPGPPRSRPPVSAPED